MSIRSGCVVGLLAAFVTIDGASSQGATPELEAWVDCSAGAES
jgi:hypothetical protein